MMKLSFGKSVKWQLLIIGMLCFTAYSFMLSGSFSVMDDQVSIVENPLIKDFSHIKEILTGSFFQGNSYYRPLVNLSYMLEYYFFGLNPFYYKLSNLILHLLSAFCVYFIVRQIFSRESVSFFVSLLFAIHPVHWEQVSHVAGRAILLCALFYFLAFLLYLYARERNQWGLYLLSLVAYGFSFLSKESAVTLPVLLLCYENFVKRPETAKTAWIFLSARQIRWVIPFFLIALGFIGWRRYLGITNIPMWGSFHDLLLGHLTFVRGFLTYLRLFFLPLDLHFDRSIMYLQSFQSWQVWGLILLYVCVPLAVFIARKKISSRVSFFLCWSFFTMLPVAQIVPLSSRNGYASLAEHFLYIPSVGIFVFIVLLFQRIVRVIRAKKQASVGMVGFAVVGIFSFFFLTTIQQCIYSSEELALLRHSLEHNPENLRIRNSYALALAMRGLYPEAEYQYRIALSVDPGNINSRISLGKTLCDQGKLWEGILEYEKVYTFDVGKYRKLLEGNRDDAYRILINRYRQKISLDPGNSKLYLQLGVLYTKTQRIEEGIQWYKEALAINPLYKDALHNLVWSFEALGDDPQAAFYCEKMLNLEYADPKEKEGVYTRLIGIQKRIIQKQNESN